MRYTSLSILICLTLSISRLYAQGDLEKLPSCINTDLYDESTPVLSRSGDRLFFTRTADPNFEATLISEDGQITSNKKDELYMDRLAIIYSEIAGTKILDPSTSVYNQDIWYAPVYGDSTGEAIHPGYPINNALPNSLVSAGMAPDEYVILNQFYQDGSMYAGFSRILIHPDEKYHFPDPMHIYEFNVTSSDVNMTMTPNGHTVILSMKRSDSKGCNDLYLSFFVRDNVWSAPIHMGSTLNTVFQETTPYISPDKRFLYFSSNRPGGKGGNDIYVSERLDYSWLKWSEPVLLKGDVNSPFDESQPHFSPDAGYMYFSSRRDGSSDIFRQKLIPKPPLRKPLHVKGKIINSETGKPVHSELFWGQNSSGQFLEYFNTYTGEFEITLTENETYKFLPRKANHTSPKILIDPAKLEQQGIDTLNLILYVQPKQKSHTAAQEKGEKESRHAADHQLDGLLTEESVAFYDINFVRSKPVILAKSKGALKYLLEWMNDHPEAEILITGHTDNVGEEEALIELSFDRAVAVRDYLLHHGISGYRLQVTGLGATRPLFPNHSESGREKNRRVEISLTNRQ